MIPPLRFFPQDAATFGEYGRSNVAITTMGTEKPARARFEVVDEVDSRQRMLLDAYYDRAFRKWQVTLTQSGTVVAPWSVTITMCPLGAILEIDAPHGTKVFAELVSP